MSHFEESWEPMRWADVDQDTLQTIRAFVDEMPNLPVHVHKLLKIVSDIDSSTEDIAKIASSDPAMVSKILKAVNSTYYGLSKPTSNLHLAIVLLGFNEVRKIALQAGLSNIFGETWSYQGYDTSSLWKHSYLTSMCAEELSRNKDQKRAGEFLTMGILHDIGKFSLFRLTILIKKKGIKPLRSKNPSPGSCLLEKEEALFSINHSIVGSILAEKWDLPGKVTTVIEHHHYPSFWEPDTIPEHALMDTALISIADYIVNYLTEDKVAVPPPRTEYFDLLGFNPSPEAVFTEDLKKKIEHAEKFITYIRE